MNGSIPDSLLQQLSDVIARGLGLHFPRDRWRDLERAMHALASKYGYQETRSYIEELLVSPLSPGQIETLAIHLTVGESYFFRDRVALRVLEERVLPDLIRTRREGDRRLRLWSAGCCRGEEPYTLAMLLRRMIPDWREWQITLLATDIDPEFLRTAVRGLYREWSFRGVSAHIRERFFRETREGYFELIPEIRQMVTFSRLNLAEASFPSHINGTTGMDIIFCRNVLMYFSPEVVHAVTGRLYDALAEGGWLFVSPAESSHLLSSQFRPITFPGVTLFRKERAFRQEEASPAEAPRAPVPLPAFLKGGARAVKARGTPTRPRRTVATRAPRATEPTLDPATLYEEGRYDELIRRVGELAASGGAAAGDLALAARACADHGRPLAALEWCDRAIALDKLNPRLHHLRALVLQEQGATGEAARSLKRALYLDPGFVVAHVMLGMLAREQGRAQEARKHFENGRALLRALPVEEVVAGSDGMAAGALLNVIHSLMMNEPQDER